MQILGTFKKDSTADISNLMRQCLFQFYSLKIALKKIDNLKIAIRD